MRIICGTDFTESARHAATVAATLAARSEDTVLLMHSLEGGGTGAISGVIYESLRANTLEQLHTEAERLRCLGAAVKTELLTGPPDKAIVQKALRVSPRMIVVSSSWSEDALRTPRLGSVAKQITENSPVPTLAVRLAEPFAAWTRSERPLRILCAYRFPATGDAALAYLKELRRFGPCDFVVAHVHSPSEEEARLGLPSPTSFNSNEPELRCLLERDLREKVNAALGENAARIRVKGTWGRPDDEMIEIANEEQADLIVTGMRQWFGLQQLFQRSVSRSLLRHAPMNVLVVPVATGSDDFRLPQLSRVLVAVDFSGVSREVVAHACALLRSGGTLHLLHVISPRELPGGRYKVGPSYPHTEKLHKKHINAHAKKLRALIPAETNMPGLVIEVEVAKHQEPAIAICQAAERFGANVICLGKNGHLGWSAMMLGSVTRDVMNRSHRPVFVVRPAPR